MPLSANLVLSFVKSLLFVQGGLEREGVMIWMVVGVLYQLVGAYPGVECRLHNCTRGESRADGSASQISVFRSQIVFFG